MMRIDYILAIPILTNNQCHHKNHQYQVLKPHGFVSGHKAPKLNLYNQVKIKERKKESKVLRQWVSVQWKNRQLEWSLYRGGNLDKSFKNTP